LPSGWAEASSVATARASRRVEIDEDVVEEDRQRHAPLGE